MNNLRDYFENGVMVVKWPEVQALVPFQMCCYSFFSSTVEVMFQFRVRLTTIDAICIHITKSCI